MVEGDRVVGAQHPLKAYVELFGEAVGPGDLVDILLRDPLVDRILDDRHGGAERGELLAVEQILGQLVDQPMEILLVIEAELVRIAELVDIAAQHLHAEAVEGGEGHLFAPLGAN